MRFLEPPSPADGVNLRLFRVVGVIRHSGVVQQGALIPRARVQVKLRGGERPARQERAYVRRLKTLRAVNSPSTDAIEGRGGPRAGHVDGSRCNLMELRIDRPVEAKSHSDGKRLSPIQRWIACLSETGDALKLNWGKWLLDRRFLL